MIKTSKTQHLQQHLDHLPVNSSLDNWRFNSRYQKSKNTHPSVKQCNSCGSQLSQFDHQHFTQATQQAPFTPVSKRIMRIPDVSQSFSHHKEASKLSLQLNQISLGFNKENQRMQQALFEIMQSTIKKEKQKHTKSLSVSKKSHTSKKSNKLKVDQNSIVKVLNFSNFAQVYRKQLQKGPTNDSVKQSKLKKKNINELMKEQRLMLQTLASNFRKNEAI